MQRVQLAGTHAHIHRTLADQEKIDAGIVQKLLESLTEVIVHDGAASFFAAFCPDLVFGSVAIINIVRRIGKDHVGENAVHNLFQIRQHRGRAAKHTVITEQPQVTGLRYRVFLNFRGGVIIGETLVFSRFTVQKPVDIFEIKPRNVQIKIRFPKGLQLNAEHLFVPARVLRNFVIGNDQRPPLGFREMCQHNHRHCFQPQPLGRHQTPVTSDDDVIVTDEDRVHKAKLGNAARNLTDLLIRVRPGIAGVGDQAFKGILLDVQVVHSQS